jgi:hypothetical protein
MTQLKVEMVRGFRKRSADLHWGSTVREARERIESGWEEDCLPFPLNFLLFTAYPDPKLH